MAGCFNLGILSFNINFMEIYKKPILGHLHPLTQLAQQIEEIFSAMGFSIIDGPEIVEEYYNFDALNIPKDHPARDEMDTFYLENGRVLRTHTSSMQVQYMQNNNPPFRIIVPGRVFRNERTDAKHDIQFHQIEGMMVDKDIKLAHLKAVLFECLKRLFPSSAIRLRPGFFPYVEPGVEVDIKLNNKWMELLGAGLIHPKVFESAGYLPGEWKGFAFGMGLERLAMAKYKIDDIRLFHNGDLRFIKQF